MLFKCVFHVYMFQWKVVNYFHIDVKHLIKLFYSNAELKLFQGKCQILASTRKQLYSSKLEAIFIKEKI